MKAIAILTALLLSACLLDHGRPPGKVHVNTIHPLDDCYEEIDTLICPIGDSTGAK